MVALNEVKWNDQELVCAIVQDEQTHQVLMVAWMNKEALELTIKTKQAHYFSRSRKQLWRKGERSGHIQHVSEIRLDCDGDAILLQVKQEGLACHTGRNHCFYRTLTNNEWLITDPVIKSEHEIYQ